VRAQPNSVPDRGIVVRIGDVAVNLRTNDHAYRRKLRNHYKPFVGPMENAEFSFDIELTDSGINDPEDEVSVKRSSSFWCFQRGDFHAEWNMASNTGTIRQSANLYSIDAALRIFHTVVLAARGGFLLHAASAIRNGRAFVFMGASGAGKTTIASLAPLDATLLTDEVSYIGSDSAGYRAFGTPFAGELAKCGENVSAPISVVYLLAQGGTNQIERISASDAVRMLLANTLFFAQDHDLIRSVFQSVCRLVDQIPVHRLTFVPDACVWEDIV
jgi:hypothetical protein